MEVDGVGERVGDPFCRYVVASTVEISTVEAAGKAVEPQPGLRDEAWKKYFCGCNPSSNVVTPDYRNVFFFDNATVVSILGDKFN